jgi:ribosome-binding factor A
VSSTARVAKLADRIKVIVAETLRMRVKDPRLGFVTITDVRVTGDLRDATVFYTVYGDDVARAETANALESAKGVLRSEVGRQTGVRYTPTLAFVADALPDDARQIEELLARAAEADAEVQRAAQGASYAGDPDPYRVSDDADGEDGADVAVGDGTDAGTVDDGAVDDGSDRGDADQPRR